MTSNQEGAVVLVSGGLDSTVLLHHAVKEMSIDPVHALSFDYGQRHRKELECAAWQARQLDTAVHKCVDMTFVSDLVKEGTSLVIGGAEVPDLEALEKNELDQPSTYVPNRNMMMLSVASAYAEAQGIRHVYYGAQAHDEYGYWDCTDSFLQRINAVLELNRRDSVTVHAPFIGVAKHELVKKGTLLGVNFQQTWSCYRGGEKACGTCPTCVERMSAFEKAGGADPLAYE